MSLELQHLPPGVVAYLDALGRPGGQAKSLHGDFLTHLEMVGEWIENLSGYTMDDPEVDQFANISALLESLRVTAEEVSWGEQLPLLVRDLYPMFAMMDRINKRREIAHHSTQAAVNDALLCGVAFLKKRAEWPALENRLDKLDAYLQGMELTLLGLKSRLQPEVVASLQSGIEAMRDGMDGLDPDRSEAENQKGLATLKEGSEILQLLIDWKVQDDEKFRREHQRFFLPGAGPAVESFLEALDGTSREQWGPALQALGQDTLPRLRSDWLALRRRLFVNPDEREAMWDEIEAALVGLEECLEELGDPGRSEDEALLGFEEAAEQLSQLFAGMGAQALSYGHLYGSEAGQLLEGIFGALGGTVPVARLLELEASGPVSREIARFAQSGDEDGLFRAGYALLCEFPAPVVEAAGTWGCSFCGFQNELGEGVCAGCQAWAPLSVTEAVAESHQGG